jgi:hypothetical protein
MNDFDLARKFLCNLPSVRQWVELTIEDNREKAVPVIGLGFPRLGDVFPPDLLTRAKVVVVDGEVPFPPISRMGLPELARMEQVAMTMGAITYNDTFFVKREHLTESVSFHETVHVVQWDTLGIDDFLLAYGIGFIQFGYRNSPLERMAYALQESFDRRDLPGDVVDLIRRDTEAIWAGATPLFSRG